MRQSNANPKKPKKRLWLSVLLTLGLTTVSLFAAAQQQSPSGAVETFQPVFDVGTALRPRAGLYGITELMMAALEADIPTAKQLIEAGADIRSRSKAIGTHFFSGCRILSDLCNTTKFDRNRQVRLYDEGSARNRYFWCDHEFQCGDSD